MHVRLSTKSALGVKALLKMSKDITEIKITVNSVGIKHEVIEDRVKKIENRIDEIISKRK